MKFLKKFATRAEYDAFMGTNPNNYPFVGYIKDEKKVKYYSGEPTYEFFNRLRGDGKAYIKTNYYMSNYDRISVNFNKSGVSENLFGFKSTLFTAAILPTQSTKGYVAWQNDATLIQLSNGDVSLGMYESEGKYAAKLVSDEGTYTINNYGAAPTEVVSAFPLYVFAANLKDTFDIDTRFYTGGISYITVTDSRTGEVKLDLRPAVMNGGVAGMKDMVTGLFFGNANSEGAFTAE